MSISAGVVSYDPPESLAALCWSLVSRGCPVRVVDNGSTTGGDVLAACERAGAEVVRLGENTGISGALTVLFDATEGDEWVLTLDQDSLVPDDFVGVMIDAAVAADPRVAVIGPAVREQGSGDFVQGDPAATVAYDVRGVITSGSLCRTAALRDVGGVRTDLFIDYVDWDLCLRLRAAGWRVVVQPDAVMLHSLGATRTHRVGGVVGVRASHHSADRQYYKYRNFILLARAGTLRGEAWWALRQAAALAWGPLKITLLEQERLEKMRAIAEGIKDGLRGRGGSRPIRGVDRRSTGGTEPPGYWCR